VPPDSTSTAAASGDAGGSFSGTVKRGIRRAVDAVLPLIWYPFCLAVRCLAPLVRLRFGHLNNDRIGELIPRLEFYLRRRSLETPTGKTPRLAREIELFIANRRSANPFVTELIARRLRTVTNDLLWRLYDMARRRWPDTDFWIDTSSVGVYDFDIWNKSERQLLVMNQGERERGEAFLRDLGVEPGDPYVCFSVRDSAYLDAKHPHQDPDRWRVHDYRNGAMANFMPMAEWFADQGIKVFRIGAEVEAPLETDHPNIIDYSTHHRTPFLDIAVSAGCALYVGDTSGTFWMPLAFERPIAQANIIPIDNPGRGIGSVFMPKTYRRLTDDSPVPFREIVESGAYSVFTSANFAEKGYRPVENTAAEILEMAKERYQRATGTWSANADDAELQQRYWGVFPEGHPARNSLALVSRHFMINHLDLF